MSLYDCVVETNARVLLFDKVEWSSSLSKSVMNPIDKINQFK